MSRDLICDVLMCVAMLLLGFGIGMATEELRRDCFGSQPNPEELSGFGFHLRINIDDEP